MVLHRREWDIVLSASPRTRARVLLAASALLYRLSWPLINTYSPGTPPNTIYSLATKFLFVLTGLSSFLASLSPGAGPRNGSSARPDPRSSPADRVAHCAASAICLLVTTANYIAGWKWALGAIEQYFTRGYRFGDPSRFDRVAVVLCSCGVSGLLVVLVVRQCVGIGSRWREARRQLWLLDMDVKNGRTASHVMVDKDGL